MTTQPPDRTLPVSSTDPTFLLWREVDRLERSIDAQGLRIDKLDEHGSRGVDALRTQVDHLRKDIEDHERQHAEAVQEQKTSRRWTIGILIALVTPLYPILVALFVNQ